MRFLWACTVWACITLHLVVVEVVVVHNISYNQARCKEKESGELLLSSCVTYWFLLEEVVNRERERIVLSVKSLIVTAEESTAGGEER